MSGQGGRGYPPFKVLPEGCRYCGVRCRARCLQRQGRPNNCLRQNRIHVRLAVELIETKTEFAKRLNLTKQYVSALVKRGLPLDRKGDVRVDAALVWLRENVRPAAGRPAGSVEDGPPDLMAEKTRLIAAQASKAELELAHLRRSLMPVDDAKKLAGAFVRQHRDHMLNFANRHGATIAADVGAPAAAVIAAIEAKMRDHMNELADTPISFEGGK